MLPDPRMGMSYRRKTNLSVRSQASMRGLAFAALFGVVSVTTAMPAGAASEGAKNDEAFEPTTPAEKRAHRLDADAMGADFRAHRFTAGEKKIRDAIQVCMVQTCAVGFKARLHRDLGYLYVAGMKHVEDGKDEFTAALTMDATVVLTSEMLEQASAKQAFEEVKAEMNGTAAPADTKATEPEPAKKDVELQTEGEPKPKAKSKAKPEPKSEPEAESEADSKHQDESFPEPEPSAKKSFLNWLTLGVEQDFVYHPNSQFACATGSQYTCFDRQHRAYTVDTFAPGGNRVVGGLANGTWRVLLGYDRVFANRFSAGLRLGSVVSGKADILKGERAFMYFHGEARFAVWLRSEFDKPGLRPYVFVSGGAAENDGKVVVQVSWDRCPSCRLNAWKRSGVGFIGGGVGLQWAITPRTGPVVEARYLQFLNPGLPTLGIQFGYAVGL